MAHYVFNSVLAYDPNTVSIAKSAAFQVYDITDTNNTTPLVTTDLGGLPVSVKSNSDGMLTVFRVEDRLLVKLVSGAFEMPLLSMDGVVDGVGEARTAAETAASAAQTAAGAAADSAALAQTRGLPSGGLVGQGPVKASIDDYAAEWGDVPLLFGTQPLRFHGAVSTLPPASAGQVQGDVIFLIGGGA